MEVNDHATFLLMVRFAQEWLPRLRHEPPATALARAQQWLRRVTFTDLQTWHVQFGVASSSYPPTEVSALGRGSRYAVEDAEKQTQALFIGRNPRERLYADPFFWAGFQIIGW